MAIIQGMAITPNKKNILVDALNEEIKNLNESIKNQRVNEFVAGSLARSKTILQTLLDSVLDKKGVITPAQTNEIVQQIEEAKKNRLQQNYIVGIKKSTFALLGIIIVGAAIYWYTKKN